MIPTLVSLGISQTTELVRTAQSAEEYGFDSIWFGDMGLNTDVFVSSAYAASKTSKIKIGIITNPYTRNPVLTATAIATLDEYSGGRALYALGPGGQGTLLPMGYRTWDRPLTAVREAVEVARRLFRGEKVTYEGKTLRCNEAKLAFKSRKEIPISITAMTGSKLMRLSGEIADGIVLAGPLGLEYTKQCVSKFMEGAKEVGRDPSDLRIMLQCLFLTSMDEAEAIARVRLPVSKMIFVDPRFYGVMRSANINDAQLEQIKTAVAEGEGKVAEVVSDDLVKTYAIVGTPDSCARQMRLYRDIGISDFCIIPPPTADLKQIMKLTSKEIMPRLK